MDAWRACVRIWALGSAAWLAYWLYDASQCTQAVSGFLLCPTLDGEGVFPITWRRLAATTLGPVLGSLAAGLLLLWWTRRADSETPDGSP